jgi:predicted Fe-S protein YdhL (DUF1289 family)
MRKRSSPCVGICSTTYGDLVCRGCKRFAHEIVAWNGFDTEQRDTVWERLFELRDGAIAQQLSICDHDALMARATVVNTPDRGTLSALNLAYEVLRTTLLPLSELAEIGIQPLNPGAPGDRTRDLVRQIDQEFYARSLAHYEHNFKIAAQ